MVQFQPEDERLRGRSIEEKLSEKFDFLQLSREERHEGLFDELVRSIEVLFKAVPSAYNDFIVNKTELDKELQSELYNIEKEVSNAQDKISEQTIRSNKTNDAEWQYREVMEEIIMEIMQKHGLVILQQKTFGEVEPVVEVESLEEEEIPEEEEISEPPEKVRKKPHLLRNINRES